MLENFYLVPMVSMRPLFFEDRGNEVTFTTFAPSPDVGEGIVWVCGRMGEIYFSNSLFLFHYFYQAVG